MELNEALQKLDQLQRKQQAYNHAMGLIDFDGMTSAPKGTAANRAETLGILSEEIYKLTTGEETIALLDYLYDHREELDQVHKRIVEVMHEDIDNTRKIPMDVYVAQQKLTIESENIWHKAKETNDYALFMPYLEKMIDMTRTVTGYVKPNMPTYDALLDSFEKGLTPSR